MAIYFIFLGLMRFANCESLTTTYCSDTTLAKLNNTNPSFFSIAHTIIKGNKTTVRKFHHKQESDCNLL